MVSISIVTAADCGLSKLANVSVNVVLHTNLTHKRLKLFIGLSILKLNRHFDICTFDISTPRFHVLKGKL